MKNKKRIFAMIGVILLLSLTLLTFISAVFVKPYSDSLFRASLFCTIIIPIILYGYILIYRVFKDKSKKK